MLEVLKKDAASITADPAKKFRFFLIAPFHLPPTSRFLPLGKDKATISDKPKEQQLFNYANVAHLLADVDWDFHPGPLASYGDWPVENREEFAYVAAGRLPLVKAACESGKYNAVVLLGGGEPGFLESREIGRRYGLPVTACAFSQMHIASMLGNKFSVIDLAESHNMFYYNIIVQHRMTDRCASIRNINYPLPRPPHSDDAGRIGREQQQALRGEPSDMVDAAVREAVAAIEEDGAEVITFGCSATFWLRPYVGKRLHEMGWEIPVLEGYSCAIELAKLMVNLGVDASGLTFPSDHPRKWRRKKTF
jgi:Asp/Glu/hydantoin racemase